MSHNLIHALNLYAPIEQSLRCLDQWLQEEGRSMEARQRQRTAALLARYFQHEDDVSDELLLSFLHHYSGRKEVDMEDPTSVRMEIKSLLDRTAPLEQNIPRRRPFLSTLIALLMTGLSLSVWQLSQKTITPVQQAALKGKVVQISVLDKNIKPATVWASIKKPLQARRYQDISWWRYDQTAKTLDNWLDRLQKPGSTAGTRM